jgi:hypothetical protein
VCWNAALETETALGITAAVKKKKSSSSSSSAASSGNDDDDDSTATTIMFTAKKRERLRLDPAIGPKQYLNESGGFALGFPEGGNQPFKVSWGGV